MPGPAAYPDWQRVSNWDSPVLFRQAANPLGGAVGSGILDLSRYAYLAGEDSCTGGDAQVVVGWYSDAAATEVVGFRFFTLTSGVANAAQYRLPNLGPFAQIQWSKVGAPVSAATSIIFATNRFHPLEFVPTRQVLVNRQAIAVAASATDVVYPSDYYAGPVDIWWNVPGATWLLSVDHLTTAGVWALMFQSPTSTVAADLQFRIVAPAGAWRVRVLNLSAAGGAYYLSVRQSQTGST